MLVTMDMVISLSGVTRIRFCGFSFVALHVTGCNVTVFGNVIVVKVGAGKARSMRSKVLRAGIVFRKRTTADRR